MRAKSANQFGKPAIVIFCPACNVRHVVAVRPDDQIPTDENVGTWRFNGNFDRPTLDPSVSIEYSQFGAKRLCHFNLTSGRIHFHGDCTHALAGASRDLKEIE